MSTIIGGHLTDFSDRLREERKRLHLNQAALGAVGGVSKDAQLNYENGSRSPDAAYLSAIAKAGVDLQYVLTGARGADVPRGFEEQQVLDSYKQLDALDQQAIRQIVGSLSKRKR